MELNKLLVLFVSLFLADIAFANSFAYSPVNFFVSTSTAFQVTLIGIAAVNSNSSDCSVALGCPATSIIYFNSTSSTATRIQPCTNPDFATNCQTTGPDKPIINITNTGTLTFNVSARFNSTLTTGVTVWANTTANGAGAAGVANTTIDDAAWYKICTNIPITAGNWCAVQLWANFSAVNGGLTQNQLFYNSSNSQG